MAVSLIAVIVAVAFQRAPNAPAVEDVRAAIWSDVELNATIGNYNEMVSWDWYYGKDRNHPPTLTIVGLRCDGGSSYRCSFGLARRPDQAAPADDKAEVPLLRCTASFRWFPDDRRWVVAHFPPPKGGGHTRSSMQCGRSSG
jgi:hypothetical protein